MGILAPVLKAKSLDEFGECEMEQPNEGVWIRTDSCIVYMGVDQLLVDIWLGSGYKRAMLI